MRIVLDATDHEIGEVAVFMSQNIYKTLCKNHELCTPRPGQSTCKPTFVINDLLRQLNRRMVPIDLRTCACRISGYQSFPLPVRPSRGRMQFLAPNDFDTSSRFSQNSYSSVGDLKIQFFEEVNRKLDFPLIERLFPLNGRFVSPPRRLGRASPRGRRWREVCFIVIFMDRE